MAIKLDLDSNPNNGVNSTSSFTQGEEPIALFNTATLDTVGRQSDHADIIRISLGGAAQDGESLAADLTGMNGFQQSFNPSTGILTISKGNGADAKWEKILQSVTYSNTNDDPVESRSIEVMAIDRSPSKITASGNYTETATATNTLTIDVICFMPGTNIAVPGGEAKVETLKPGDLVMTTAGEAKAVRWIGRQTVSRVFADRLRVLPIRVKAGALGENVPCRDLLISPDHAVLVDGVLVQAGALVNGSSIVRESDVPQVYTYYHVELDDHSLILAENVAAETFIDNVNRLGFDNWAEHEALYPDRKPIEEMTYPRANSFRQVPQATRLQLATRGEALYGGAVATAA